MPIDFQAVPQNEREGRGELTRTQWRCCLCGISDRGALRFAMTAVLSTILLLFSCGMLAFADLPCSETQTFVGLITLTIGYWLKSPLD